MVFPVHPLGWPHRHVQHVPVHQPSYYTQFGPLLHDWTSYHNKLHDQGLTPYVGQDLSPPFILTNNASPDNYNSYQGNYHQGSHGYHKAPSYHHHKKTTTHQPKTTTSTTTPRTTTKHQTTTTKDPKGKHKFNHTLNVDKKNGSEHAKKPLFEVVTTKKPIKYVDARDPIVTSATTKKPTVDSNPLRELLRKWPVVKSGINARVNETVASIRDQFEANVVAIESLVNSGINKPNEYIGNAAHALVTTMALLVKNIEQQLERLSYGSAESTKEPSAEKLQWPSAKNPLSQVLTRWPTVKSGLIARVNEKVKSIRDQLESQVAAIQNIGNSVMEQPNEYTGEASTSLVNRISEILGNIEKQLLRLESDSVKSLDVNFDDAAARAFHLTPNP